MNHEHPVTPEELMAYADGQLQADRTSQIGAHLESCPACEKTVADAKGLSRQMATWQVEDAPEQMTRTVLAALAPRPRRELKSAFGWWTKGRTLAFGLGGAVFVLVAVVTTSFVLRSGDMNSWSVKKMTQADIDKTPQFTSSLQREMPTGSIGKITTKEEGQLPPTSPSGPMIIRTVQLTLVTKSFDTARTRIEAIVQDSKGYVDSMSVRSEPKSPKSLSAVLRIPDEKLATSLIELRKLGQPKEESQNSADVTGQYRDLVARLANARNTEQRLLALLRDRTGNLKDVVAAEGEISRVREEIERMEAERKNFDNKVQYATVQVELSEEYHAQLEPTLPTAGTRIYNAAVEGYQSAGETILGIALTTLADGPAVLVWLMFLTSVGFIAKKLYVLIRAQRLPDTIAPI